ncbi:MAG: c-type cytochrome [Gemmatimonadetes bacterium]|nr:cytochrome c [Gemmatimonadota bacterium]NIR78784.1 cytochrome c [Gemmatimonadota bacterium]NIT87421.1 cytochrome c [Gemmatimonadota bacterium]NIU31273.1 cytochrome c [Gemmatimonadota bacterium]NIU35983.1 c-type cytochrome [Gemmatimonadota bacterium]
MARGAEPLEAPSAATGALPARFGFGRPADSAEILRLEIDVLPDGSGLPPGRGTVARGARIYRGSCASCHGATGREGPFDPLVSPPGEREFPTSLRPAGPLTVGNYWPRATSLFEYVARAMPMHAPGTLDADEVYAVVAWILHRNGVIEEDDVIDRETLPRVPMPGRSRFVVDDRTGGATIR